MALTVVYMVPVDVVIVSYNTCNLLRNCLRSLYDRQSEFASGRVIVVDNSSGDASPNMVEQEFPEVVLIRLPSNIGFGPANNRGFVAGESPCVLFLNSDTVVLPGSVALLREALLSEATCFAVGPRLIYPDGSFHASCRRFPTVSRAIWQLSGMEARCARPRGLRNWLTESEHRTTTRVDMVSGACFMVRRPLFEQIGGFDERIFLYEEEMDLFLRARQAGLHARYVWDAVVEHHHGASSGEKSGNMFVQFHQFKSRYYCFRKHYGKLRAQTLFWADQAILGLSAGVNRLRGTASPANTLRKISNEAFRESCAI